MRIQDMVLVIENIKGKETNMLMTLQEYKEAYLFVSSLSREESAELLKGLFDTKFSEAGKGWAECYITANKSYYAKFCSGSDELQCFLHGSYNDDKEVSNACRHWRNTTLMSTVGQKVLCSIMSRKSMSLSRGKSCITSMARIIKSWSATVNGTCC